MRSAPRFRPRFGPIVLRWLRYRRLIGGIFLLLMLYWLMPSLSFQLGDCTPVILPRFPYDLSSAEQLWDHRSTLRRSGVVLLYITRVLNAVRMCPDGTETEQRSQLTLVFVPSTGSAPRTEQIRTEPFSIGLGDVVALEETVYALLYRSAALDAPRKPYRLLRLHDSEDGSSTAVAELPLPSAERHTLVALESDVILLSYAGSCTTRVAMQRLGGGGGSGSRSVSVSLPSSARVVDVVRLGAFTSSFVLQAANCGSGLDEWLLCDARAGTCAALGLPPGAVVRYYSEPADQLVFTARVTATEGGAADGCWVSSVANLHAPSEAQEAAQLRLCECGAFCVARTLRSAEVHAFVAIPGGGYRYDTATLPIAPPAALGWPAAQFPSVHLATHAMLGLTGEEFVRVWRGARITDAGLLQALSVELRGSDAMVFQTPLVPFPMPRFERLLPGDFARCPVPRRLTHIESPAVPAVALTFTDAPTPLLVELLPLLHKLDVHATFFVRGDNALRYPDLVHRLALEGHALGVEAMHARRLVGLKQGEIERELSSVLGLVYGITGTRPCLVRPPGSHTSPDVESAAEMFALSSSYATTPLPHSQVAYSLTHAFDMWAPQAYPHRSGCRSSCRGAVLEMSLVATSDVRALLQSLQKGIEELRRAQKAVFVRVTGEPFPSFPDRVASLAEEEQ